MPSSATVGPYRLASPSASIITELTGASTYLSTSKDVYSQVGNQAQPDRPLRPAHQGTRRRPRGNRTAVPPDPRNPAIPARDRVRLSCALGALLSSLMTVSDLGDLSIETYGDLLCEAITDLLEPRGDVSRTHRADER